MGDLLASGPMLPFTPLGEGVYSVAVCASLKTPEGPVEASAKRRWRPSCWLLFQGW